MAELDQKDYHKLDAPLSEILSSMKLKDDERKEANKYLIEIIENEVIPAMQDVDEFFKIVYKRLTPSGSYYENLKISKPNEFDRNVELAIPFKDIEVRSSSFYGYVQVKCNGDKKRFAEKGEKILKNWLDSDGMLKRNEVLQWMQSVMDRALCKKPIENVKIFPSRHGPAITLTIIVKSSSGKELEFCVDLVPVFSFDEAHWPKPPVRQPFINLPDFPKTWCIVPKEVPNNPEETTHWRISFYDQERRLMNGYNAMKAILKLIKKLRDCQNNCDYLSSYYIKTVFLWEMEKEKYSEEFWQKSIGVLFIDMLKRLVEYIKEKQCIPFFWDERHNLISKLEQDTFKNLGNRIENIINKIEKNLPGNPDYVKSCFPGWDTEDPSSSSSVAQSFSEEIKSDSDTEILSDNFSSLFSDNYPRLRQRQAQDHSLEDIGIWGAIGIGALALALGVTAVIRGIQENNRQ